MPPVTKPLTTIVDVCPPIFPERPDNSGMNETAIGALIITLS